MWHCLPRVSTNRHWNGKFTRSSRILKKLAPAPRGKNASGSSPTENGVESDPAVSVAACRRKMKMPGLR
jgi:hypothetical protein